MGETESAFASLFKQIKMQVTDLGVVLDSFNFISHFNKEAKHIFLSVEHFPN